MLWVTLFTFNYPQEIFMVAIDVFFHVRVAGSMILADQGYDTDEILVFIENKDAPVYDFTMFIIANFNILPISAL